MKLKLDLHPIYNDTAAIESSLRAIIDDAVAKRASEVEIIPGKGSGALKKTVIRFLDRPEIKARYHRLEKDGDNWGRLFVHFRHERPEPGPKESAEPVRVLEARCFCCDAAIRVPDDDDAREILVACPSCESPNRVKIARRPGRAPTLRAEPGYE
jgi:hypothetical protein